MNHQEQDRLQKADATPELSAVLTTPRPLRGASGGRSGEGWGWQTAWQH